MAKSVSEKKPALTFAAIYISLTVIHGLIIYFFLSSKYHHFDELASLSTSFLSVAFAFIAAYKVRRDLHKKQSKPKSLKEMLWFFVKIAIIIIAVFLLPTIIGAMELGASYVGASATFAVINMVVSFFTIIL